MKAWNAGVGGCVVMLLLPACGSPTSTASVTQTVTALRTVVSTQAVTSVSTMSAGDPVTLTETATATTTVMQTETATETVTAAEAADTAPSTTDDTTPAESSSAAKVKPQTLEGTGDDVVKIAAIDGLALLKFDCPDCSGNVTLETDGAEGLLVNTIGSYSGTHLINVRDNSVTSQLTISAEGSWTVSIADASTASRTLTGKGDTALILSGSTTAAHITNAGKGNFVVEVYSSSGSDLAVNEIGSYSGTVPLSAPAFVQITSEGSWSIEPK